MIQYKGKFTDAEVMIDEIESSCAAQIVEMVNYPVFDNPIKIMPDAHAGMGSVIGFTMEMGQKLIPNVIGVDIGCGMLSLNLGQIKIDHEKVDKEIRKRIPFGMNVHNDGYRRYDIKEQFPWLMVNRLAQNFVAKYQQKFAADYFPEIEYSDNWFQNKCSEIGMDYRRAVNSIGTLGGGNHFIEFGISDKSGDVWLTIHSGSRNFGKCICDYWQSKARDSRKDTADDNYQKELKRIKETVTNPALVSKLIKKAQEDRRVEKLRAAQKNLEWLDGQNKIGYLIDMIFAQIYADHNRLIMARIITRTLDSLSDFQVGGEMINTVHNYIDPVDFIIRKGAISSYEGQKMIIPFNMEAGLLICEGKSNPDWNFSAPHGAGRVMSRKQAKTTLQLEDFKKQMQDANIFTTSTNAATLDEAPGAYKDPALIERALAPTAIILERVKPIHNLKG